MQQYKTELGEFHRQFLALEEELGLFDITLGGVPIWERIRERVKIDLLAEMGLTGEIRPSDSSLRDKIRGSYLLARNAIRRNPFVTAPAELVFFGHPRRKEHSGQWLDIYCDPLYQQGDLDTVHLEPPWEFQHFRPAATSELRYTDLIEFVGQANAHIGAKRESLSATERAQIERIQAEFEAAFDVEMELLARIQEILDRRAVMKPLYTRLLNRIDPSLAVIVAHSSRETFIESCHDVDVPVAELQHGQISPYSYQHAFPGDRTKEAYPDYLLTFGEFWETAASLPIESDRVIPVGYPYFERELDRLRPLEQRRQVVVISTPEAGPRLSKIAADLSRRRTFDYDIVYKLHPGEYQNWETKYPWLTESSLSVAASDGPSLYELFAESSIQVGVGSTALYEGLAFELSTYLVREPTVEWLGPVIETGGATVVESASALVDAIGNSEQQPVQREQYFKPDAVSNALSVLEHLAETATVRQ